MPSTEGVFSCLRQRARSTLVGRNSATAIVDRLQDCPKYVSLPSLSSVFASAGFLWTEEEVDYIVRRFADNRRRIDWWRLIRALDVTPPEDFTDPDRSFVDQLPQPYRLVVSVLETDILDRAWAQVVAEHPELDTSPADEARAAVEIDLKRSCPPGLWLHPPTVDSAGRVPTHEAEAKSDLDGVPAAQARPMSESAWGSDDSNRSEGMLSGKEACITRRGGGVVTSLQWDNDGEFLFTGSCDGSVSLRRADAFEHVLDRVDVLWGESCAAVTCLSRPVRSLGGRSAHPACIRIAAVATEPVPPPIEAIHSSNDDVCTDGLLGGNGGDTGGVVADTPGTATSLRPPRYRVYILEMVLREGGRRPGTTSGGGDIRAAETIPTIRSICYVDLPREETVTELSLSCDGRRLVVASSVGSVALWTLPPFSSLSCMVTSRNHAVENDLEGGKRSEGGGASHGAAEDAADNSVDENDTDRNEQDVHSSAIAAAVIAAAVQLGRPEIYIPHLPSPEEREYNNMLEDYQRRVDAGEIEEAAEHDATEVHLGADSPSLKPKPPSATAVAYHLASVTLLPNIRVTGTGKAECSGVERVGLAVWRSRSNVWRLYRLPDMLPWGQTGPPTGESTGELEAAAVKDTGVPGTTSGNDSSDGGLSGAVPTTPIVDVACIPSAEWVLPSPVTLSVPCDAEGDVKGGWDNDTGRQGSSPAYPPLVAIGTENGGVYICDGALGTTRKGLSMHRAKVTALAFHGRRFLISGSEDEMIHIHDITASPPTHSGYGGGGVRWSCTALRCLHDARGSGIVRVNCLNQTPLTFVEDTSGRIVAYDVITGTVLGILRLEGKCHNIVKSSHDSLSTGDGVSLSRNQGLTWAAGGDFLTAVLPSSVVEVREQVQSQSATQKTIINRDSRSMLGIWSAADVIWGLCPGVRELKGHERPTLAADIVELFHELGPTERKGGEVGVGANSTSHMQERPGASCPNNVLFESTRSKSALSGSQPQQSRKMSPPAAHRTHRGGSSRGTSRVRTVESSPTVVTGAPSLTEGNIAKLLGGKNRKTLGTDDGGLGGMGEIGAAERVRRYIENRHGDRAARQTRIANVTRTLMQAL